jgi:hypothetical protein
VNATARGRATVHLENTGKALAFQVRLMLVDAKSGGEPLPVFWDDNYVALLPGESRDITVEYSGAPGSLSLRVEGWNVTKTEVAVGGI